MSKRTCICQSPPFNYLDFETIELGMDSRYAAVSMSTCKYCGETSIKYLVEEEGFTASGRWWVVNLKTEDRGKVTAINACEYIEKQASGFYGGSYFNSTGEPIKAPIKVF